MTWHTPIRQRGYAALTPKKQTVRVAHTTPAFHFPCAPPSSAGWSGVVGEDCLSAKREFRSRLTSRATEGTREAGGKPGSPSSWRSKKK